MTSRELFEQAAQHLADARKIQDAADAEKRDLTAEEDANYGKYFADYEKAKKRAEDRFKLEQAESESRESAGMISDPETPVESRTDGTEAEQRAELEAAVDAAFNEVMFYRSGKGPSLTAAAEYEKRALQADVDITGGYTVAPAQFVSRLIQAVDNLTFFPSLATVIPVTTSDKIEGVSLDTDPADPAWTAEIGAASEDSSMAFGGRALQPNQLTKLLKVSRKLLMVSALPVEQIVRERLAYKLAVTAENVYLNGTGAGQPLGVFTASANGITTSEDVSTGNSTTAFTFDGLKECKYALKSQYWPRSSWIMHRDAVKMASKLKDGEGQYQWQESVVGGDPDRLLGFPVRISEYAPNTFTTGLYVGILGDFSNYWIAQLQEMDMQRLDELYAANNQVGFVLRSWFDGMPVLAEAFRRVKLA